MKAQLSDVKETYLVTNSSVDAKKLNETVLANSEAVHSRTADFANNSLDLDCGGIK